METDSQQAANLEAILADATFSQPLPASGSATPAVLPWDDELELRRQEARRWLVAHPNLLMPSHMALVLSQTVFSDDAILHLRRFPIFSEDVIAPVLLEPPASRAVSPVLPLTTPAPSASLNTFRHPTSATGQPIKMSTRSRKSSLADGKVPIDVVDAVIPPPSSPSPPASVGPAD